MPHITFKTTATKWRIIIILACLVVTSCTKTKDTPSPAEDTTRTSETNVASASLCGNNTCDESENCITCNRDCQCSCGDGICTYGEYCGNCASDCDCELLAATPPMGWNSWNKFACDIDEDLIRDIADTLVTSGLKDAGYNYLNLDDCWQKERNQDGEIVADPEHFPSGIPALADYVHSKGLKFGLYTCAGSKTCEEKPGSLGYEEKDAATYASWKVDFIKVDWCFTKGLDAKTQYKKMHDALQAVDRPIVHSICNWGVANPWVWGSEVGQLWRTSADIKDNYLSLLVNIEGTASTAAFASPGHWNDPDMLEVGNGGMTFEEYRSHMAIWSILSAPLILGNDIRKMDENTRQLLTNETVLAVNRDPAGHQGVRIQRDPYMIWTRPLTAYGKRAVVLFNYTEEPQAMEISWAQIGLAQGAATVRDAWSGKTIGSFDNMYKTQEKVSPHDSRMLIITGQEHQPPAQTAYISDLPMKHWANSVGPVERDQSNGDTPANDGKPMTISGKTYDKGVGVKGSSVILYHLGGRCKQFTADVGLDDAALDKGSVVFTVSADGDVLFESDLMTGTDDAKPVTVDITDRHELTLRVSAAGDSVHFDDANWANAQLHCQN